VTDVSGSLSARPGFLACGPRFAPVRPRGPNARSWIAFLGAIGVGLLAALFFSVAFILNRRMELEGGAWEWTASLRFLLLVPVYAAIVRARGGSRAVLRALRSRPLAWLGWGTIGFGLFYAPMAFAAASGPGWLVAGTWQVTILAGLLLAPLLYRDHRAVVPRHSLAGALVVLLGVVAIQAEHVDAVGAKAIVTGIVPVVVAAFAYPAGNRKTMELAGDQLNVWQRILTMTIASLPFWLVLSALGLAAAGPPSAGQLGKSAVVALSAGLIATTLFFAATTRVRHDPAHLAAVEGTQAAEVVFAAGLEMLIFRAAAPSGLAWAGVASIAVGMLLYVFGDRTRHARESRARS
jgi:putative multidrug resistance efflux transporter